MAPTWAVRALLLRTAVFKRLHDKFRKLPEVKNKLSANKLMEFLLDFKTKNSPVILIKV